MAGRGRPQNAARHAKEAKTAIDYLKQMNPGHRDLSAAAQEVVQGSRRVIWAIDAWTNHRVLAELRGVLDAAYYLSNVGKWKRVIASIPNRVLDLSQRTKLVGFVTKAKVARYLYRTAKGFPIARYIRVGTADLPPAAFDGTQPGGYDPCAAALFQRLRPNNQMFADLCRRLGCALEELTWTRLTEFVGQVAA